ncbi:tagaturonate reductase [Neolewinella xylanilytica]|uniref:Tagaturonate reductase n=1 Tax=Neolewinella xylanilytica TaxID=1514080 RepID=A0A2S6IB66_9BACT|nr:tagaturonate reductase [Neolewinella xylanilytica]PPK88751.1 tagaturonate reductase [Neolewinella xylanilytica]
MQALNRNNAGIGPAPTEAILQFGGGNFLRGFADWIVEVYNRHTDRPLGVLVANNSDRQIYRDWRAQDGLYHVLTRGIKQGELVDSQELITNVSRVISMDTDWDTFLASAENPDMRYIISNTTEAGIRFSEDDRLSDRPPAEFPAKLTAWLNRRFQHFKGAPERGCVVIPMELIEDNGSVLRGLVIRNAEVWKLGSGFTAWVHKHCTFCSTLVDRIVPGVGADEMQEVQERTGYEDVAVTQGEPYHLLAIKAPAAVRKQLPLDKIGLNILYTDDLTPYRRSKVAILNGAHTSMVPVGYLSGKETVGETLEDALTGAYIRELLFEEIIPILSLPEVDLEQFADDVLDRFRNPFIHHQLLSISLNSVSKFRTRVLPSLLAYVEQQGHPPHRMVIALAALIRFYRGDRNGQEIPLKDDAWAIAFLQQAWKNTEPTEAGMLQLSDQVLGWERAWEQDLRNYAGLKQALAEALLRMEKKGMEATVAESLKK